MQAFGPAAADRIAAAGRRLAALHAGLAAALTDLADDADVLSPAARVALRELVDAYDKVGGVLSLCSCWQSNLANQPLPERLSPKALTMGSTFVSPIEPWDSKGTNQELNATAETLRCRRRSRSSLSRVGR